MFWRYWKHKRPLSVVRSARIICTGLLLASLASAPAYAQQWRRLGTVDNSTVTTTALCDWAASGDIECPSSNPRVSSGALAIGASAPDASAALDVTSTAKGFLPPRMTTVQVGAVATPSDGLIVYDVDTDTLKLRANGAWVSLAAGSTMPAANSLDFSEFKNGMTLDVSTDIAASGTNVLSITNSGSASSFIVNDQAGDATPFVIDAEGDVGIGTTSPGSALDVKGVVRLSGSTSGYVGLAPAAAAGSTTYTLPTADGSSGQQLTTDGAGGLSWTPASAGTVALSSVTGATDANTINNGTFAQTWNWSTTTQVPMTLTGNSLSTGSILALTSSSDALNSTNGLLYVANTGSSLDGIVARIAANSSLGSGLTVMGSGGVGIGTASPDGSALLELNDTSKGFLLPRLTTTQRNAITTPANGLLVYNATTDALNLRAGGSWTALGAGGGGGGASSGAAGYLQIADGAGGFTSSGNSAGNQLVWDTTSNQLGIGTATPVSKLDVNGGIRLGNDAESCVTAKEGTLRFSSGKMQICVNLAWTDLAVVSGTAPLASEVSQPFTLTWPDAIVCATASETRYYYAEIHSWVASLKRYREVEGNNQLTFDNTGRFISSAITGTNCQGKSLTDLVSAGQTFNFKSGTATTMRSGWPDALMCPRSSTPTTRLVMYLTLVNTTAVRYRDFNGNEYVDFNPTTKIAGAVTGQSCDEFGCGAYSVGSLCDGQTTTTLYSGTANQKAFDLVGGDGTKSFATGLPDNIVCRDGNGDQWSLYRSHTDATATIRYQTPYQTNNYYVDFNPTTRAPTAENLVNTPDCYLNLDVLVSRGKAFGFADNGSTTSTGSTDNNPVITQPVAGSGNPIISGWPDVIVCRQAAGVFYVLRYNKWRSDSRHIYETGYYPYYIMFNEGGSWNTHAGMASTDCMNSSIQQLTAAGNTKNLRESGAATSIISGWPDVLVCTQTSDGALRARYLSYADATYYYYYSPGSTAWWIRFLRNGSFHTDNIGTSCDGKSITQLSADPAVAFSLYKGVDDGSAIASVPDGIVCTNTYGKKSLYWLDVLYQNNTDAGLQYRSNQGTYIRFNSTKPYTFYDENGTDDCAGKSIAQLHKEGATVFLNDTNNIGSVPAPYTPEGGSVINGWPDMILCVNNNNYPYLFHIAYQDATYMRYYATNGSALTFNNNQTFYSIGPTYTTCQNQTIDQLTANGQTFNYSSGGGASGTGGTPAGSDGQVQFRKNGQFAANASLFWNDTTTRLGIGTTTPSVKLDVAGAIKVGTDTTTTCSSAVSGALKWSGTALQVCDGTAWSSVGSGGGGTPGGTTGQLQFNNAGSFGGTTNLTWDDTNTRIGLNTTSPQANLHIVNPTTNNAVVIDEAPSASGESHIVMRDTSGSRVLWLAGASSVGSWNPLVQASDARINFAGGGVSETGGLVLAPWSASAKGIRIDGATGNVGIGIATPGATLEVNGSLKIGTTTTCAAAGTNNGTLRFDANSGNVQLCLNGAWSNLNAGSSSAGAGSTMFAGWPDAVVCRSTTSANFYVLYNTQPNVSSNIIYYNFPWGSAVYYIAWTYSTGAYNSQSNMAAFDCATNSWSMQTMNALGRTFNFVGGQAGAAGSNGLGTNASMYSGWPDAIQCVSGSTDRSTLYFASRNETSGAVTFRQTLSTADNSITYSSAGAVASNSNMSAYDCVANASFDTINELYSQSRAFNLASSSAVASGAAGAVQFSGGANLVSDATTFFWDNTNKRLGIGQGSAAARLHIYDGSPTEGSIRVDQSGGVTFSSGLDVYTAGTNRGFIGWRGTASSAPNAASGIYLWNRDTSNLVLGTANTERMRIDSSGNVGVGSTAPLTKLDVSGGVRIGNDTCTAAKVGTLVWTGTALSVCANTGSFVPLATASGVSVTPAGSSGQVQFNSGGTALGASPSLVWDNTNARLGIGSATPQSALDIERLANAATAGAANLALVLNQYNASASEVAGEATGIGFNRSAAGSSHIGAKMLFISDGSGFGRGDLAFSVKSSASNGDVPSEVMRLKANGNVGLGIATPGGLGDGGTPRYLHLHQASSQAVLGLTSALTAASTGVGSISFGTTGTAAADKRSAVIASTLTALSSATVTGDLNFWTSNAGTIGQRMRIMSTGEVGIGTTTPQALLDVNGGVRIGTTSTCAAANGGTLRWTGTAVEVCNGGSWISIGSGGGSGSGATMTVGFPDALYCSYDSTTFAWAYLMYRYADGRVYYQYPPSTSYYVIFNASGTYNTHAGFLNGGSMNCTNRSISQLYSEGKAFNFVGGGGTNGGSTGTNASMVSGIPDVISCLRTDGADNYFYMFNGGTSGEVYYNAPATDWIIRFNKTTGLYTTSSGTYGPSGTISSASGACLNTSTTLASLYSQGRAFNLAASSAVASGTAGAVQFSGGANLLSDVATLFWDNTNKRLAIGQGSAAARLHIYDGSPTDASIRIDQSGGVTFSSGLDVYTAGTSRGFIGWRGTASSAPNSASGIYLWNRDTSNLLLGTANTERLRIDSSGNVGVATPTPAARLDVNGGVRVGADATCNGTTKAGTLAWNSNALFVCANDGSFKKIADATGTTAAAAGTTGQIQFNSAAALGADGSLFWDNTNKRLGIGTSTPAIKLHVSSSSSGLAPMISSPFPQYPRVLAELSDTITTTDTTVATGPVIGLNLENASQTLNTFSPFLSFSRRSTSGSYNPAYAMIGAQFTGDGPTTDWSAGSLVFYTASNAANGPQERIRITSTGNVGIGTASPSSPLQVSTSGTSGVLVDAYANTSSVQLRRANGTSAAPTAVANGDAIGSVSFAGYGATGFSGGKANMRAIAAENWTDTATGVYLVFATTPVGSSIGAERLRIDAAGNVGIGTTTPQALLDVNGGVRIGTTSTCAVANAGTLRWTGSAVEVCNGGSWSSIGAGSGSGSGGTFFSGMPDAIICSYGSDPNYLVLWAATNNSGNGALYGYLWAPGTYYAYYNAAGTLTSSAGITTTGNKPCAGKRISELYAAGQAFNLVGGGGTSGGSTGTNASMISGWPDTIQCLSGTDRRTLMQAYRSDSANTVTYRQPNTIDVSITYSSAGAVTANADMSTYDCVNNAAYNTITELYSQGRAFNLAASSAVASGTVGAVQFSGGANLLSDVATLFWDNTNKRLAIGQGSAAARLHIYDGTPTDGSIRIDQSGGVTFSSGLDVYTAGTSRGFIGWRGTASSAPNAASGVYLWNRDNSSLVLGTANTERMRIDSTGNAGLGTTAPAAKLDVNGGVKVGSETCSSAKPGMLYWDTGTTLKLCANGGTVVSLATAAGVVGASGAAGQVQFSNSSSGFLADANFFWDNTNKRLGIGTSTPAYALDVTGGRGRFSGWGTPATTGAGAEIGYDGTNSYLRSYNRSTPAWLPLLLDGSTIIMQSGGSSGSVGIGTTTPGSALDIKGTLRLSGATSGYVGFTPAAVAGSTTYTLPAADGTSGFQLTTNGAGVLSWAAAGPNTTALSALTASTATNTIDSSAFAQTWNWSTATTQNPLTLTANALTTGSLLSLTSSSASINSTNGLLYVANTGATTTGTVARIAANAAMGSGLTVLANGNIGIGTTAPSSTLDVKGTLRLSGATSGYVGLAPAAAAGSTTYTLPSADGANGQALTTNGSGTLAWSTPSAVAKGLFYKADSASVAFTRAGNGTVSVKAGTQVEVNGGLVIYSSATAVTMPALAAGTDYAIYACGSGSPVADSNLSSTTLCTGGSRKIGGFHYAPGGNAAAQAGGDTTPQINPFSLWDLKFKPSCRNPAGMTLVADSFWVDIYLLGVDHHVNGTSKFNVTIADGSSPPKVPAATGGNGTTIYGNLTWYAASEIMQSHGKDLLSYGEFMTAMYGTTEASSGGTDPVSTILRAAYTSKWGVMLATGNMWVWGRDMSYRYDSSTWAWQNVTGGRGQTYIQGAYGNVAALLGGSRDGGAYSGSRASNWGVYPWHSDSGIGARGRCDHLILD